MSDWSINEVTSAREAVAGLLDALALDAYLFQVEPADARWEVTLEWANQQQWSTTTLCAGRDELLNAVNDPAAREEVLRSWRRSLGIREVSK